MVHLRSFELGTSWLVLCHNCAARADKLSPMPRSVEKMLAALERERRVGAERRREVDTAWFGTVPARRGVERRAPRGDGDAVDVTELATEEPHEAEGGTMLAAVLLATEGRGADAAVEPTNVHAKVDELHAMAAGQARHA